MWIFSANTSPSAPPKTVKSWREHEHLAAVDRAPAGDDTVGERPVVLDAEAVRAVAGEHVELDERAGVEQQVDALAGGELAALVLAPDRRLVARRAAPLPSAWRAARGARRSGAGVVGRARLGSSAMRTRLVAARGSARLARRRTSRTRDRRPPRLRCPHSYWYGEMPPASHGSTEPASIATSGLRHDAELGPHVVDRACRVGEPVDAQQVGTTAVRAAQRAAAHRVGEPDRHALVREVTAVVLEQPGAARQVAGLEQADHHREQRERARIVVGARDEREHLDLALDRRAVVGEHVHPVVLREQRRRAPGPAGERRSPARRRTSRPRDRACRREGRAAPPTAARAPRRRRTSPTRPRAPPTCAARRHASGPTPPCSRCAGSRRARGRGCRARSARRRASIGSSTPSSRRTPRRARRPRPAADSAPASTAA